MCAERERCHRSGDIRNYMFLVCVDTEQRVLNSCCDVGENWNNQQTLSSFHPEKYTHYNSRLVRSGVVASSHQNAQQQQSKPEQKLLCKIKSLYFETKKLPFSPLFSLLISVLLLCDCSAFTAVLWCWWCSAVHFRQHFVIFLPCSTVPIVWLHQAAGRARDQRREKSHRKSFWKLKMHQADLSSHKRWFFGFCCWALWWISAKSFLMFRREDKKNVKLFDWPILSRLQAIELEIPPLEWEWKAFQAEWDDLKSGGEKKTFFLQSWEEKLEKLARRAPWQFVITKNERARRSRRAFAGNDNEVEVSQKHSQQPKPVRDEKELNYN